MKVNIKKIVLLGQSQKFTHLVHLLFDKAEISTIPWRNCMNHLNSSKKFSPDLVVVCGYDYASSHYAFEEYIDVNVSQPYEVISAMCDHTTRVIYIDTEHGANHFTFSRYQYAKNLLAQRIVSDFHYAQVLITPTILNKAGEADIHGGFFTRLIFNFFIRLGLVKSISLEALSNQFFDVFKNNNQVNFRVLTPRFLTIRRTLFADRLLRLING